MRALVPVVMAGIISIYGLVVGVVIAGALRPTTDGYTLYKYVSYTLVFIIYLFQRFLTSRSGSRVRSVFDGCRICGWCVGRPWNSCSRKETAVLCWNGAHLGLGTAAGVVWTACCTGYD